MSRRKIPLLFLVNHPYYTHYVHTTYYILHTTYYVQNKWSHSLLLNSVQARQNSVQARQKKLKYILKLIVWEEVAIKFQYMPSSSWFVDRNVQNIVLINNSRTSWPTTILIPFFSFSDNLLQDTSILFFYLFIYFIFYFLFFWDAVPYREFPCKRLAAILEV